MKRALYWIVVLIGVLAVLKTASCAFGAEPTAARAAADIPSDVEPTPNYRVVKKTHPGDEEAGRRRGERGEEGLKGLDDDFDLPSPLGIAGSLVSFALQLVWFIVQLLIVALVAWIAVRAARRTRETGSPIPQKGDDSIFDAFDKFVEKLDERRAAAAREVEEINRRLPSNTRTESAVKK